MSNEWRDLDVNNLPSDILVEGAWETQHEESDPMKGKWYSITVIAAGKVQSQYRIRRPEGWEPKECPRCGGPADNGYDHEDPPNPYMCTKCHSMEYGEPEECPTCGSCDKRANPTKVSRTKFVLCTDTWHDEPKAPTHKEILAPRFWKCDDGVWRKLIIYRPQSISARFGFLLNGKEWGVNELWFINRESADTPPAG